MSLQANPEGSLPAMRGKLESADEAHRVGYSEGLGFRGLGV